MTDEAREQLTPNDSSKTSHDPSKSLQEASIISSAQINEISAVLGIVFAWMLMIFASIYWFKFTVTKKGDKITSKCQRIALLADISNI